MSEWRERSSPLTPHPTRPEASRRLQPAFAISCPACVLEVHKGTMPSRPPRQTTYIPIVSSPLSPNGPKDIPEGSPRYARAARRTADRPMSPTQWLMRQKAATAWISQAARNDGPGHRPAAARDGFTRPLLSGTTTRTTHWSPASTYDVSPSIAGADLEKQRGSWRPTGHAVLPEADDTINHAFSCPISWDCLRPRRTWAMLGIQCAHGILWALCLGILCVIGILETFLPHTSRKLPFLLST